MYLLRSGKAADFYMYPTVFRGPTNCDKAKDKLGFVPTEMDEAFRETIKWYGRHLVLLCCRTRRSTLCDRLLHCRYTKLFVEDEKERDEMMKTVISNVVPR